jgi:hypothetical protein
MLDYLRGIKESRNNVRKCSDRYISVITWMELSACLPKDQMKAVTQFIIQNFSIVGLDRGVAEHAVYLREECGLKMPDAIIYACARTSYANLLTRNAERYDSDWMDVYTPYEL